MEETSASRGPRRITMGTIVMVHAVALLALFVCVLLTNLSLRYLTRSEPQRIRLAIGEALRDEAPDVAARQRTGGQEESPGREDGGGGKALRIRLAALQDACRDLERRLQELPERDRRHILNTPEWRKLQEMLPAEQQRGNDDSRSDPVEGGGL